MIIYFIRHGETELNKKGITQGHKDSPLTSKGKKTADILGRKLINKKIGIIYSSDLGRCMETSKIINKYLKVKIISTSKLRERNFGDLNGKPNSVVLKNIDLYDLDFIVPKGESYNQMKERIISFIKSLSDKNSILLITHEGCVRAILSEYYNINPSSSKCNTNSEFIGKLELKNKKISILKN